MSRGDFHTHSTRSDGTLTPTALVELAWRNGVRVQALTDHDTLEGISFEVWKSRVLTFEESPDGP